MVMILDEISIGPSFFRLFVILIRPYSRHATRNFLKMGTLIGKKKLFGF
jgi:hypothetical protein